MYNVHLMNGDSGNGRAPESRVNPSVEDTFRSAVDKLPDAFAILSAVWGNSGNIDDFQYYYINEEGSRLNRLPARLHQSTTLTRLFPSEFGRTLLDDFSRVVESGEDLRKTIWWNEPEAAPRAYQLHAIRLNGGVACTWREIDPSLPQEAAGGESESGQGSETEEREQRNLAEALRATAGLLISSLKLDEVLQRILENIERVVYHKTANIMLLDNGNARIVRCSGYPTGELAERMLSVHFRVDEVENFRYMIETGQALAIPDTALSESWIETLAEPWQRSYAGAPIRVKGKTIGFLNLDSDIPGFFSQADADRLQAFADQAAIAIENARLFEETQQRSKRLALINEISATINQPVELYDVWQTAVDTLAGALGIAQTSLALLDEERKRLMIVAEHPAPGNGSGVGLEIPLTGNPSMDHILSTKSWLASYDVRHDPMLDAIRDLLAQRSVQSILLVPLLVGEEVIGTLGCDSIGRKHDFNPGEITLAVTVANLVATKIEQARLLEAERRTRQEVEHRAGELRQQAMRMELLNDITLCSLNRHSLPEMLDAMANRLCRLIGADGAYISLWDAEKQVPYPAAAYGARKEQFLSLKVNPGEYTLSGEVLQQGRSIIFHDLAQLHPMAPIIAATNPGASILVAPLIADGQDLGAVIINFDQAHTFTPDEIALCEQAAGQVALATAKVQLYEETQKLAITDDLTGVYNRRGLYELGKREVERALRFRRPLSLIMLDIDHFKHFNDSYGHVIGDQALRWLAATLQENVRDIDIVGRYGGEEFVVLLPENHSSAALQVAARIHRAVMEGTFHTPVGELGITVSLGLASASPQDRDLDAMVRRADAALYRSKEAGRNRITAG